ncbi:MAG: outer membrane lipoprotein carrier protein LolA [Calditrichaeota bacterium]|nr:outer membrane lipoprotein carrier protein LolA [Calditrichota bacterium]
MRKYLHLTPYTLHLSAALFFFSSAIPSISALTPESALKDLRKKYKSVQTLRCNFREVFEWALTGETVVREGLLTVTADNRMRVETPEQSIISDGQVIHRYNRERKQVMIETVAKGGKSLLLRKFMLEFADMFDATAITPLAVEGQKGFRLDLISRDKDETLVNDAALWVTEADLVVRRLKITDLNHNTTTYLLSDIKFNTPVDAGETSFSLPDGVEVFDLR